MGQWFPIQPRKVEQVERVNPALPQLALRDIGLRAAQSLGHLDLREPSLLSCLSQTPEHFAVPGSMNSTHAGSLWANGHPRV